MPSRTQAIIRRDINRLNETIERHKDTQPALAAISRIVNTAAQDMNNAWQRYQATAVAGDREREERQTAIRTLIKWIQKWRPVMMLIVRGADSNIRNLPSSGATPDDVIRVAEDMLKLISENLDAKSFRASCIDDLGDGLENAKKETLEATSILPQEAAARHDYSETSIVANTALNAGLNIIRSRFGPTSPEYKQFIARDTPEEEEAEEKEIDAEVAI